jgi:hypothetical protein
VFDARAYSFLTGHLSSREDSRKKNLVIFFFSDKQDPYAYLENLTICFQDPLIYDD